MSTSTKRIMKYLQSRSFLFLITVNYIETTGVKRFLVVSSSTNAERFYSQVRDTTSRPESDVRAKRQICEDITSNNFFLRRREYPFERSTAAVDFFILLRGHFGYPDDRIKVSDGVAEIEEPVFVCLTRHGLVGFARYYISNEYNLNARSNTSTSYLAGRFVFRQIKNAIQPLLVALAEVPAEAISSLDHNIDYYYLQRRKKYPFASLARQNDPLCKLPRSDWHRICVSVFNSTEFADKIIISNADENKGYCERKTLFFEVDFEREDALTLDEWMLNCRSKDDYSEEITHYWLSHAYQSDQIFVYASHRDYEHLLLRGLAFNVRITFDPTKLFPDGDND